MTREDLSNLDLFFTNYTKRFAAADGRLHPMQQLKVKHSRLVADNAAHIMAAEGWSEARRRIGAACALLHDVGRFSQFAQFATFEDRKSINHAAQGVRVLRQERALAALPPEERRLVLTAIACHNTRALPPALAADVLPFAHLVRDADKLDIFRLLDEFLAPGDLAQHPEVVWGLPYAARANPAVLACIAAGQPVDYEQIRSLCDFVLIQVGWMRGQLYYATSAALAYERGALDVRERFVLGIDPAPEVRECFTAVRAGLRARLGRA